MAKTTVFPGFFCVNKNVSIGNVFVLNATCQGVVYKVLPELVQLAVVLETCLSERLDELFTVYFEIFA